MTGTNLRLTVNGAPVSVDVEPRTSIADVLRDHLRLTGTHLGCEQGACGACTVLVDGVPVRSCIGSALTVDGADIHTIEGLDDDPIMQELRDAFRHNHALQCGFCTPGMLVTARDVVKRLPSADKERIRIEMSGNLCRCTGYSGIINAVHLVGQAHCEATGVHGAGDHHEGSLGPAGSGHVSESPDTADIAVMDLDSSHSDAHDPPDQDVSYERIANEPPLEPTIHHRFVLNQELEQVAERFQDMPFMISCIPGAALKSTPEEGVFVVLLKASIGPISAEFEGVAEAEWVPDRTSGTIKGHGRDERNASTARGTMSYELSGGAEDGTTEVTIHIGYALSGALGQFARGAIVKQFVTLLAGQFAENFERKLAGSKDAETAPSEAKLKMGRNLLQVARSLLMNLFRRQ